MEKKKKSKTGIYGSFRPVRESLDQAFADIDRFHNEEISGSDLSLGFTFLNDLFVGRERPFFSIISAPTGVGGNTGLGGSLITKFAINFDRTIGIFSMQISSPYYSSIMLSIAANIDHRLTRSGRLPSEQWPKLSTSAGQLAKANIYINDCRPHSIKTIRKSARKLVKETNIDLIIIDSLQYISTKKCYKNKEHGYQKICESLKDMSDELNVSILLMSYFSDTYDPESIYEALDCASLRFLQNYGMIPDAELYLIPGKQDREDRLFNLHIYRNREGLTGTIGLRQNLYGGGFEESEISSH